MGLRHCEDAERDHTANSRAAHHLMRSANSASTTPAGAFCGFATTQSIAHSVQRASCAVVISAEFHMSVLSAASSRKKMHMAGSA